MSESKELSPKVREQLEKEWFDVFKQLLDSDRFRKLLSDNFEIDRIIDDDNKTITMRVLEKPFVEKITVSLEQTLKLQQLAGMYGVKKTVDFIKDVIKVLENKGKESKIIS